MRHHWQGSLIKEKSWIILKVRRDLSLVLSWVKVWIEQFQLISSSPPCPSSTVASASRRWLSLHPLTLLSVCLGSKSPLVTFPSWHPSPPSIPKVNKCYCFSLPHCSILQYAFCVVPLSPPVWSQSTKEARPERTLMTSDDVCPVIGPEMWIGGEEGKYTKMLAGHKSQKSSGIKMYSAVKKYLPPSWFLKVLHICHT